MNIEEEKDRDWFIVLSTEDVEGLLVLYQDMIKRFESNTPVYLPRMDQKRGERAGEEMTKEARKTAIENCEKNVKRLIKSLRARGIETPVHT